jgi:hypothetical protein
MRPTETKAPKEPKAPKGPFAAFCPSGAFGAAGAFDPRAGYFFFSSEHAPMAEAGSSAA